MNTDQRKQKRIALWETMKDSSALLLFSGCAPYKSNDGSYPFSPNRNFLYLTGVDKPRCALMITRIRDILSETLFVERPSAHHAIHFGQQEDAQAFKTLTGIQSVEYVDRLDSALNNFLTRVEPAALYMDFENRPMFSESGQSRAIFKEFKNLCPYAEVFNVHKTICNLRRIKTPEEIQQIKKAIQLTAKGISSICENLREGIYEYQLQAYFEFALKMENSQNAFDPIIASGKNSALIHYSQNNRQLQSGELLLIDLGAEYNYYSADISRTYAVGGKMTERQQYYYDAVKDVMHEIMEKCLKPGLIHNDTWSSANKFLAKWLKQSGLITEDDDVKKYMPHGVCHHLGLDTHDPGEFALLEPGMVITCEPGVYIPEYGFGIRIEDDVLITDGGYENLSEFIAK